MSAVIATWPFSLRAVNHTSTLLHTSTSPLDALTSGISLVEQDPTITSVGYGGLPNSDGFLQLDAAIVTSTGACGSAMSVSQLRSAIPLARLILLHSPHSILAADGAALFAKQHGLHLHRDPQSLLTPHAKARYEQYRAGLIPPRPKPGVADQMTHTDTVGMIVKDSTGFLVAGCATSGMEFKHPGRVGDSPIIGAGLYADECGAAVATGDGDEMMRFCVSYAVVQALERGLSPQEACEQVMNHVFAKAAGCQAAVVAMSKEGEVGGAGTRQGFRYAFWEDGMEVGKGVIRDGKSVAGGKSWGHTCV